MLDIALLKASGGELGYPKPSSGLAESRFTATTFVHLFAETVPMT